MPHAISVHKHKLSTFRNMPVLFSEMCYSHMYFYSKYTKVVAVLITAGVPQILLPSL